MPITPTKKIWMDGELVDWENATTHVLSHTLHYGLGAFEGIRAYKTPEGVAIFRLREHMERLQRSCKILMIDLPYTLNELCDAAVEVVRVNELTEGCYMRPIVYLGYGEMGINPLNSPVNTVIAAWPWGSYLGDHGVENGVKMKISSWARHHPNSMPTASKTIGGYVNSSLAKVEALKAGYDEAIMLGTDGLISECTGENLFIVRERKLISPPPSGAGALRGITQASIVKIANDLGYEVSFEAM
ncbi:MAG TPA: branched-chain amino acid transaminase, partial [Acidimicrobiales bacterium]|nr:branched-chain amino acid transaminase [Acidimicrobiales bacterium]